ncbi:MAG: AI-2E family transporter [Eubacteriales bacterium]|nr:AI-2E family transporter [Eubacteriales bacterium]
MKFNKNLFKEKWFAYTFAACTAVVLYLALTHLGFFLGILGKLWQVGKPVFTAIVIAYVMDPLVEFFSKNVFHKITTEKLRHMLSVVLSILTVVLFFSVLMVALVPQVIDSIVLFVGNLNGYVLSAQRLMRQLNSLAAQHDINLSQFISSSDEMLQSITRWLPENVNKIVNLSYGLGTSVFGWIISFILAIYLMLDGPRLKSGFVRLMRALLPTGVFQSSVSFWSHCNNILVRYIAYDLLDGLIIGLINWLFMLAMKMPYVAIVSVIVGVTNLAPTFGPMIGAVIGAFILVLVNPWHALWFLLFTMVLQTVDGYILKPRLFGEQLGVSSVWILIALIIGGRMMGVAGILLAIPAAAIADYFYHDFLIRRLEANKEERMRLKAEVEAETAAAAPGEAEETGPAKTEAEAVPRAERVGMEAAPRTEQIEGEAVPRAERAEADALRPEGGIPPKPAEKTAKTE